MHAYVDCQLLKFLLTDKAKFLKIADVVVMMQCEMFSARQSSDKLFFAFEAVVPIRLSAVGEDSVTVRNVHGENLSSSLQLFRAFWAFVKDSSVLILFLLYVSFMVN